MLALVCALYGGPIKSTGFVYDLVEAKLVVSDEGRPRMTERGEILSLYICGTCENHVRRSRCTYREHAQARRKTAG
jgi:hypothetical protein